MIDSRAVSAPEAPHPETGGGQPPTCEHCERPGVPSAVVSLGAHGDARLCAPCVRAVLDDDPCPLGADCPEQHGWDECETCDGSGEWMSFTRRGRCETCEGSGKTSPDERPPVTP